jgi:hypothetical protein
VIKNRLGDPSSLPCSLSIPLSLLRIDLAHTLEQIIW